MPEPSTGPIRNKIVPKTVADVLDALDSDIRSGEASDLIPIPLRFTPLDSILGGGIRAGELLLVGGMPGVGKTVATLQWARNIAIGGAQAIFACYEHEEAALLGRLLALEVGELPHSEDDAEMEKFRLGIQEVASGSGRGLRDVLDSVGLVKRAYERVQTYADRLWLVKASGAHTGVEELADMALSRRTDDMPLVLFVDYLQKVSVRPEPPDESEKVTRITEGLKDLALTHRMPIVCNVAADKEGLKSRRLRLHHLRGSSALAYEADIAIILNDKYNCVSKVHLAYDPIRAESFRNYAILTVEKNRGGPNLIDLEFRKDFLYYRFDPTGDIVTDKLVDERMYEE